MLILPAVLTGTLWIGLILSLANMWVCVHVQNCSQRVVYSTLE